MNQSLRVLIVEDSEDDTALIIRHLRRGGYEVFFERVETAEAMSAALVKKWDLVMCDYSLPRFSGTEALSRYRQSGSDVPFIFVSGTMGEGTAVAAMKAGAQNYVMKDNLNRLLPAVARELRDADERRERKKLERHVQQLERFEGVGQLAGGIAHDFNNAIGAILACAQMGYSEAPSDSNFRERFQKIQDQARHASVLTAQLLAFARRQILLPRNLSLNNVIADAATLLQTAIGEHIQFNSVLAADLLATSADPTQLQQVLLNLCMNARDAMPDGGRLEIETVNAEITEGASTAEVTPGPYVLLKLSDTGIGMDEATLDRIFEPFFTTKGGEGTGLGLSTVYGIVKQHGGFIRASSEPGRGTSFAIYLPATAEELTMSEPIPPETTAEPSRPGPDTILIAEDHEGLRELAYEILSDLGYRVLAAPNGEEAMRVFETNPHGIQLVLLDVVMPLLGGLQTYARMRAIRTDFPVIFTTGHTDESAGLQSAIREGAVLLRKPYSLDALRSTVMTALDGRFTGTEARKP